MISAIDTALIVVYILGVLVLGWYVGKSNKSADDYYLAGRSMGWWPIAISVAASMISANGFIGGPGWAYTSGIKPFMVNIGVPLAITFVMITSVPLFYNLKVTTVYEYVELRFGPKTRVISVVAFLANSIIQVSSMVFIPALFLQTLTGWDIALLIPIVVSTSVVYTLIGGIKADIWTDVIQFFVMWFALFLIIAIMLNGIGLGFFDSLKLAGQTGKLNAIDFSLDLKNTNAFWATLIGGTFMWVRYFGFDQVQIQRILTSKSIRGIKQSFFTSAVLMNTMYFIFMIVGVLLYVFYKGRAFANENGILIDFITNFLPVGAIGIVIAGLFAAAMSSIDSLLNSMSAVFVKDIYERFFAKDAAETTLKQSITISAIWALVIMFFTFIGFIGSTRSVLAVVGSYIAYISGPMCGVFFLALFTEKANDTGVATGIAVGFGLTLFIGIGSGISWIWMPAIGLVLTFSAGMLFSMLFPSPKTCEEIRPYTVLGQRRQIIASGKTREGDASLLPLEIDRYVLGTFSFFVFQYVFLAWLAN